MKHCLMLAALLIGSVCMAENLLKNGDMKESKNWSMWGNAPKDAATRAKVLTYVNEGPEGARVLKFEDCCENYNPYLIQWAPVSGVTPEQQYKLSFSLKAPKGQVVPVSLQMIAPDPETGKDKYVGACASKGKVVGTGDWQKYEVLFFKAKTGVTKFGAAIYPQTNALDKTQTGSFLLTDVSLELVK